MIFIYVLGLVGPGVAPTLSEMTVLGGLTIAMMAVLLLGSRVENTVSRHEDSDDPVLFRCEECGRIETSIGTLHAHIEDHRGYTRFNIQNPFIGDTKPGKSDELMKRTEVLRVSEFEKVDLDTVRDEY